MCGIAGFVNDMPIDVKCPVLQRMTDMIAHRGPDSEGHYIDEHAALGHRRLSFKFVFCKEITFLITLDSQIISYVIIIR